MKIEVDSQHDFEGYIILMVSADKKVEHKIVNLKPKMIMQAYNCFLQYSGIAEQLLDLLEIKQSDQIEIKNFDEDNE